MRKNIMRLLLAALGTTALLQAGCLSGTDVQSIAEGQLISFVNALINTATSDALHAAIGT
jgi:hypothetical protein